MKRFIFILTLFSLFPLQPAFADICNMGEICKVNRENGYRNSIRTLPASTIGTFTCTLHSDYPNAEVQMNLWYANSEMEQDGFPLKNNIPEEIKLTSKAPPEMQENVIGMWPNNKETFNPLNNSTVQCVFNHS